MSAPGERDLLAEVGLPSARLWRVTPGPLAAPAFLTYACSEADVRRNLPNADSWVVKEVPGEMVSLGLLHRKAKEAFDHA